MRQGMARAEKVIPEGQISPHQMVELQEMHCAGCGRFLGFQAILLGAIKIKCSNCKEWNTIDILPEKD